MGLPETAPSFANDQAMPSVEDRSQLAQQLAGAPWRTSTRSQTSNCVEVAPFSNAVAVQDSKNRITGGVLTFNHGAWRAFTKGVSSLAIERPAL